MAARTLNSTPIRCGSTPMPPDEIQPQDGEVAGDSHVALETRRLRRVPLKDLRIDDLRLLIGQGIGLPFLMPMAVAQLEAHPFAAGDSWVNPTGLVHAAGNPGTSFAQAVASFLLPAGWPLTTVV